MYLYNFYFLYVHILIDHAIYSVNVCTVAVFYSYLLYLVLYCIMYQLVGFVIVAV